MKKISLKGVIIGGIVDVVATNVLSTPLVIYAMSDVHNIPSDKLESALTAAIKNNPFYFSIQILIGCACSILGGYIAAKIAKRHELLNGLLSSYLCIATGLYSLLYILHHVEFTAILELCISPALGLLGGYVCWKRKPKIE